MTNGRREWSIAVLTFLAATAVNGFVFAYGYGQLQNRVTTLEKQREELRTEWVAARARIEAAIKEIK